MADVQTHSNYKVKGEWFSHDKHTKGLPVMNRPAPIITKFWARMIRAQPERKGKAKQSIVCFRPNLLIKKPVIGPEIRAPSCGKIRKHFKISNKDRSYFIEFMAPTSFGPSTVCTKSPWVPFSNIPVFAILLCWTQAWKLSSWQACDITGCVQCVSKKCHLPHQSGLQCSEIQSSSAQLIAAAVAAAAAAAAAAELTANNGPHNSMSLLHD